MYVSGSIALRLCSISAPLAKLNLRCCVICCCTLSLLEPVSALPAWLPVPLSREPMSLEWGVRRGTTRGSKEPDTRREEGPDGGWDSNI